MKESAGRDSYVEARNICSPQKGKEQHKQCGKQKAFKGFVLHDQEQEMEVATGPRKSKAEIEALCYRVYTKERTPSTMKLQLLLK